MAVISTLTHQQAAIVRTRLDTYNETLRKRNRQPLRDVREIFAEVGMHRSNASPAVNSVNVKNIIIFSLLCICARTRVHIFMSVYVCACVPVIPPKGLTVVDDLSPRDLTRVGFISHIELSTFLLALGVQTKRSRRPRTKAQEGTVFGVTLKSLLENDRKKFPGVKIPVVFQKFLSILEQSGLQMEGILRVPASVARLKYLRRELDRHPEVFDWSAVRQVDAAGLLKLFIRELPTPLLTYTHLPTFRSLIGENTCISSELHQVQALQLLTLLLPEAHRETLRALLVFLRKVVSHQDQNRMSLWNVSMVMAPNLFSQCNHGKRHSLAKQREEMEEAMGGAQLIQLMIQHQDLLWTIPNFLLAQVRQLNQASNQKQLILMKMRPNVHVFVQITKLCEGVIQVHAPQHTKVSMAIQLEEKTTAKDVTARFEGQNSPPQHLYEVGGNICEYCLLLGVYKVNPCCDWVIKPGPVSPLTAGDLKS
uniref:Rho GTPase activating protein 28 n=1 Tax=Oryzias latipes TaxID=8090 RepID=H2MZK7_ORYLA